MEVCSWTLKTWIKKEIVVKNFLVVGMFFVVLLGVVARFAGKSGIPLDARRLAPGQSYRLVGDVVSLDSGCIALLSESGGRVRAWRFDDLASVQNFVSKSRQLDFDQVAEGSGEDDAGIPLTEDELDIGREYVIEGVLLDRPIDDGGAIVVGFDSRKVLRVWHMKFVPIAKSFKMRYYHDGPKRWVENSY
ncbi:MAG: hypothetical protein ABIP54_04680 [Candidatus Andersenbacteria bacterium]